jgi:hypothetical protein
MGESRIGNILKATIKGEKYTIIENDVLMRYLIPCYRKSDGVRGFYDLAAGENDKKFYTNIGSGTFAKGADVNSSGWQPTSKLVFDGTDWI